MKDGCCRATDENSEGRALPSRSIDYLSYCRQGRDVKCPTRIAHQEVIELGELLVTEGGNHDGQMGIRH